MGTIMLHAIDCIRLQLGLCPSRLLLLARYSSGRTSLRELSDLTNAEMCALLSSLCIMLEHGLPTRERCCAMAG